MTESGCIFDIQGYSIHDGPGIRTLVFLKGCPMRCPWCSNPESQRFEPEIFYDPARCIGCKACLKACIHGAVVQDDRGRIAYDRRICRNCGACVETCYAEARVLKGRRMTAEEVMAEVIKEEPFMAGSGGGLTLGGGEPLAQPRFAAAVLRLAKDRGIHTAVETAGPVPFSAFEAVMELTDLFLFDLKHADPAKHLDATGVELKSVLDNLARLVEAGKEVIARTPVIPGFNDTEAEIAAVARSAADMGLKEIHLLPYHRFGEGKYRLLGRQYPLKGSLDNGRLVKLADAAKRIGLKVKIGG